VTLGSSYGMPPDRGRPELAAPAPALRTAMIGAVNYEGTFGTGGTSKCAGGGENCFAFQAPPANASTLAGAGVDIVNTANNHAWDFGAAGWRSTRSALRSAGVVASGAPNEIRVLRRNGTRVAFVGFSTYPWTNSMDAPVAIIKMAAKRADIVVAFMHAGAEGAGQAHVPYGREHAFGENRGDSRAFGRAAIDAGADLVLGSGPHVLRGVQLYRKRLIAYSLGNLAGWHNFNTGGQSALSGVLTIALAPDGRFFAGRLGALRLDGAAVPHEDPQRGAVKLMRSLTQSDFRGGHLKINAAGLIVPRTRKTSGR
jgi:poly-gamma-glutamate capsule biosynthesis protein CapA/YwtB (metallophosphatase superfamily)